MFHIAVSSVLYYEFGSEDNAGPSYVFALLEKIVSSVQLKTEFGPFKRKPSLARSAENGVSSVQAKTEFRPFN